MSLKAFHIVFVTAAVVLSIGCGVWGLKNYWSADGRTGDLVFGLGSFIAATALVLYERYFLKKSKGVSYL